MARRITDLFVLERTRGILQLESLAILAWFFSILFSVGLIHKLPQVVAMTQPGTTTLLLDVLIGILLLFGFYLFFRKRKHIGTVVSLLMAILIFSGLTLYTDPLIAILLSALLFIWERKSHSFFSNNVYILIAVLFGSIPIGVTYTVPLLVFVLLGVSIYDVFGVFLTNFIPRLARRAIELDVPLLMAAPKPNTSWLAYPSSSKVIAILGAGDIILPCLFISAVTIQLGPLAAIYVFIGAILGSLANTFFAIVLKRGIPAMPFLSIGMILGLFL